MPGSVRVVRALLAASLAAVALGQGDGRDGGAHGANKLAGSSSPYLLAHSAQPVHWLPWGEEALALARQLDKPIFLSIGYSACHWCHVMAKESFADPEVAARLNEQFVCIKVDREQRPDVDEVYMAALQAMGKPGGWPLSAWLTPAGKPFYAGTYFPPQEAHGLPAFRRVVDGLGAAWRERRAEILAGADELTAHLQKELAATAPPGEPTPALVAACVADAARRFDGEHGGFGAAPEFAPKFPSAFELLFLLSADGDAAWAMARRSLQAMARGGIHDQLGGGFHRYAVDRAWVVPHFEKMLYDNALLAEACYAAWRRVGCPELRAVGDATIAWLLREMQTPDGGFCASLDAQSDGGEGRFYVWSKTQFDAALGDDAARAAAWFGVTSAGNFGGSNVLTLADGPPAGDDAARFAAARQRLMAARAQRPRPATDDKVIACWNGLALRALAAAVRCGGPSDALPAARRCATFLLERMVVDGRVHRTWRRGAAEFDGGLDDHAAVADGLLAWFEVDPDPRWLDGAKAILAAMVARFDAGDGGLWNAAADAERLVVRTRTANDGALPSGPSLAAQALLRGGLLLGDGAMYDRGVAVVRAHHARLAAAPAASVGLVAAARWHLAGPREVVVCGEPGDPATQALLAAVHGAVRFDGVVALAHAGNRAALAERSPLFAGKESVAGRPAAYVCRRGVCAAPVTDAAALAKSLAESLR